MVYAWRYLLLVLYTVLWGTIATVVLLLDRSGRAASWIARIWIRWIFRSCGIAVEAEGLEHLDPAQPYVIMTNHQSVLDVGALVLTLPRDFAFVAKRELTWIPFFGWALGMSQIVIDRGNREKAVASLRAAASKVRAGRTVIIFPEGTRSPVGELRAFKSGGFHLAIQAQVPILPGTVSGSHRLTPKRSLRLLSGTIKIVYGRPIPTRGLGLEDREALKSRVHDAIRAGYDAAYQEGDAALQTAHAGATELA